MEETVKLKFSYTQDEFVKAERRYLFASGTITGPSVVIIAVILVFSVLYCFLSSFSVFSVVLLIAALLVLMLGCVVYFYIPEKKFQMNSKYHEEYELTFSEEGIHFKTPSIDSRLEWDIYSELWENDKFYFLIQAKQIYTIIPRRAFSGQAEEERFEAIALRALKCSKRIV